MSVQHSDLTGSELHEPKGADTASAGTVYVADGAGGGSWQDPLAEVSNLNSFEMSGVIADISTAASEYRFVVARDCSLTNIYSVMGAAITGTDAEISIYKNGVLQGQSIAVPVSGSGDGVLITTNLSPTYSFVTGDIIKLVTDGTSTGTSSLHMTLKFTAV